MASAACGGSAATEAYYPRHREYSPSSYVLQTAPGINSKVAREEFEFQNEKAQLLSETITAGTGAPKSPAHVMNASLHSGHGSAHDSRSTATRSAPTPRIIVAANAPKGQKSDMATDAHDPTLLVYTAGINLAVYQVSDKIDAAEKIIRDHGGYLSKRGDQQLTVRVPRDKFFAALALLEKLGDVLHRDIQALDVTDEYIDLEARLKNARSVRDRLEALLSQAPVIVALEIARELSKVTELIEKMEGQMKLLRQRISFATITISFSAHDSATVQDRSLLPFPWLQRMGLPPLLSVESQ